MGLKSFLTYLILLLLSVSSGFIYARFTTHESRTSNVYIIPEPSNLQEELTDNEDVLTVMMLGDIMLGRSVNMQLLNNKDVNWPFVFVSEILSSADMVIGNLENAIIADCPVTSSGMKFCTGPESVLGLKSAGIDIVSLANNHSLNYGEKGLAETVKYLDEKGIASALHGVPNFTKIRNTTFGVLAYDFTGIYGSYKSLTAEKIESDIQNASDKSDFLAIFLHWGNEYTSEPADIQRETAHRMIEAGADAVIGSHPHWIQTHENYLGKPIYYSLGNFVFDQEWSAETKKGLVLNMKISQGKLIEIEELTVKISDYGQPHWDNFN